MRSKSKQIRYKFRPGEAISSKIIPRASPIPQSGRGSCVVVLVPLMSMSEAGSAAPAAAAEAELVSPVSQRINESACEASAHSCTAGTSCTSNAFTTLFAMARSAAARSTSPTPSHNTSRSAPAAPQLASMERDRIIGRKRPSEHRQAVAGVHKRGETEVKPATRVGQYKGQMLVVSSGALHCSACKCNIQNIKSTIDAHVATAKHKANVEKVQGRIGSERDLHSELVSYYMDHPDERGSSVAPEVTVYRMLVVQAFLAAGIPLSKVDELRGLLERYGHPLTAAANLRQLVPKVEAREIETVMQDVDGQYLSLAFDGTTRLGEAVNVVGRFCSSDFVITRRLLRFVTLARHADAAAIAGLITNLVVGQLHIPFDRIVGWLHDSAAVNGAAVRMLGMFTSAADVMCVSHTLNNTGGRLSFPHLGPFSSAWVTLMSSHAARNLWAAEIGRSPRRYSSVRWHALAEMQFEVATHFSRLDQLMQQCEQSSLAPASVTQIKAVLSSHRHELRCELAAMLDMRCLVAATYDMEGDRLEILLVYDRLMTLMQMGDRLRRGDVDGLLPNLDAVMRADSQLSVGTVIDKVWPGMGVFEGRVERVSQAQSDVHADSRVVTVYKVRYPADGETEELEDEEIRPLVRVRDLPEHVALVRDCLVPAFDYLDQRFAAAHANLQYSCAMQMEMFKALRMFNPAYVASVQISSADVDTLAVVVPIAQLCALDALKRELPAFVGAAAGVVIASTDIAAFTEAVLAWWRAHAATIPTWARAARIAFALSPNSASCERVFSLLESMFGDAQMSALSDYMQAALMLRYHGRRY